MKYVTIYVDKENNTKKLDGDDFNEKIRKCRKCRNGK